MVAVAHIRRERLTVSGLSLALLMTSLDTSMVNTSLPALARAYHASFQSAQWIVLAYLLAVTALTVALGRLGDLIGRRRLLLWSLGLFLVASPLCALTSSLAWLVAARAAQGVAAAAIIALAFAFVGDLAHAGRGVAMGRLAAVSAVGTMLGPTVASVVGSIAARTIFLVNVPVGVAALFLLARHLPDADAPRPGTTRFDAPGTVLLVVTLGTYALSVTYGKGAWTGINSALLAAAVLGAAAFRAVERRASSPLIPLTALRDRDLTAALAANVVVTTMVMASLIVGPFYLARGLALPAAAAGLVLSTGPATAALTSTLVGRWLQRSDASRMAFAGLALMTAGAGLLAALPRATGVPGYIAPLLLLTAGYAAFQTANNTAIMAAADQTHRGLVAGLLGLSRNLGLITGTAVMGALFHHATGTADLSTATPAAAASGLHATFTAAALVLGSTMAARPVRIRSLHTERN